MGPPAAIFPANRTFPQDLREVGLKLNPEKSKCYIKCTHMGAWWDKLRGKSQTEPCRTLRGYRS